MGDNIKLKGTRIHPSWTQALMELLNGGPEIGRLTIEQQDWAMPKNYFQPKGRMIFFGTAGEIRSNGYADMFRNPEKYDLKNNDH